ncbi:MAG: hypothetical protein QHJ34_02410 [bacterium]|jgi:hypothetical protein|nr:hypothetical protein [candidate division KSB1 bacterium]MDH7559071.1 hypothetical protein [bacterium]
MSSQTLHGSTNEAGGEYSRLHRMLAAVCVHGTLCRQAHKRQRGLAFALVCKVEERLCPFCRAYRKVYGRKAHEPMPGETVPGDGRAGLPTDLTELE